MIITKIAIDSFGKLENFTLEFSENVNVILGQNESGKSTLCAFIYAMFYGLPNESKRLGIREDWRKHYPAWNGKPMSGTIYFTDNDFNYVLSRKFGKNKRTDKVSLKNAVTWEEITDINPEEIGNIFLGIGAEAFLKTLFITQSVPITSRDNDDEILKRLSNLRQSGEEDISYQAVFSALEKAKLGIISKNEKGGLLPNLQQKKENLEQEALSIQRLSLQFKNDILKQTALKDELVVLEEETDHLIKQKKMAKEHERYLVFQTFLQERDKLLERKSEIVEKLKNRQEKHAELSKSLESYKALHGFSQGKILELAQIEKLLEEKERLLELIAEKKELISVITVQCEEERRSMKNPTINIGMLIVATIIIVSGIVSGIFVSPVFFFLPFPAVLLAIITCKKHKEQKKQNLHLSELEKRLDYTQSELEKMNESALIHETKTLQQQLSDAFQMANVSSLRELSQAVEQKQNIIFDMEATEKELVLLKESEMQLENDFKQRFNEDSHEQFTEETMRYDGLSEEEIDTLISTNHRRQLENRTALEEINHRLEMAFSSVRSMDVILSEIDGVRDQIAQYERYHQALSLAEEMMEKSYLQLKQDFAPLLNNCVGDILFELTDGKYSELKVADDYKIMLRDKECGEIVSAEYLSAGTYDALYLALRFGISQTILPEKKMFLILDDAFLQLDDKRAEFAVSFLERKCIDGQVLYFTCHESQSSLFSQNCNKIVI